ncbi:MAG: clostripain-related cysteine peptidase, partial [Acidobacteria bacterium]|nr:clostripain-related cysteine peptidase [Acidobacteriota bacterium]
MFHPGRVASVAAFALLCLSPVSAQVVINEVLFRLDPASPDAIRTHQWVELLNKGADPADLTGWTISARDGKSGSSARSLPAINLPSGGYLVVHFTEGQNRTDFADGTGDYYTGDTAGIWNGGSDEAALYSADSVVDFVSWSQRGTPYDPGPAHEDAVAAHIWTKGRSVIADWLSHELGEKPRSLMDGSSLARNPDSKDDNVPEDFDANGGEGALDVTPNRQNLTTDAVPAEAPPEEPVLEGKGTFRSTAAAKRKWTVMIYAAADNNLETAIFHNIRQIADAGGSDDKINFVILFDGKNIVPATIRGRVMTPSGATSFSLQNPAGSPMQLAEQNTGDPATLKSFIEWSKANYPASRYALVISSHGNGWKGVAPDDSSVLRGFKDRLYMGELKSALSGSFLDLLVFDACLMQAVEVAYTLRSAAPYIVASEEVVPGPGFPYQPIAQALKDNADMTPVELGTKFVTEYQALYTNPIKPFTMALVDTSKASDVALLADSWGRSLQTGVTIFQGRDNPADNVQSLLRLDRAAATIFEDDSFVDLSELATLVENDGGIPACAKAGAAEIVAAIPKAVLAEAHSAQYGPVKGIHIYFPRLRTAEGIPIAVAAGTVEKIEPYDYPWPSMETDGNSRYASYVHSHDFLPLKALDRTDGVTALRASDEWPQPSSPNFDFPQDLDNWPLFLERYYHPVADNHIASTVPAGFPITSSGGGACANPTDQVTVPIGTKVVLSGNGSSDADMAPNAAGIAPVTPYAIVWDKDATKGCPAGCVAPTKVAAGADPILVANDNMDQDRDPADSSADEKDFVGPVYTFTCEAFGQYTVTQHAWDDNQRFPYHRTLPDAGYVHPQTSPHVAVIECQTPVTLIGINDGPANFEVGD